MANGVCVHYIHTYIPEVQVAGTVNSHAPKMVGI